VALGSNYVKISDSNHVFQHCHQYFRSGVSMDRKPFVNLKYEHHIEKEHGSHTIDVEERDWDETFGTNCRPFRKPESE